MIVAGLLMLFGQALANIHDLDPDTQAPEHACEVCLAAAGADAANVGDVALQPLAPGAAPDPEFIATEISVTPVALPPSRGPPAAS